jgi:hypothetical protein
VTPGANPGIVSYNASAVKTFKNLFWGEGERGSDKFFSSSSSFFYMSFEYTVQDFRFRELTKWLIDGGSLKENGVIQQIACRKQEPILRSRVTTPRVA